MKIKNPVFSYNEFYEWMAALSKEGKSSGEDQSQVMAEYTSLNSRRMKRLNNTVNLQPETLKLIEAIKEPQTWYLITETWCGDSAQNLPVIAKIAAAANEKIDLRIILRDENPEWIDKYRTHGGKSIPKLVSFDQEGEELFSWGPRPLSAHHIMLHWKENPLEVTKADFEKELHTWYAQDKSLSLQKEFVEIFEKL
jgi:hypothetical protein